MNSEYNDEYVRKLCTKLQAFLESSGFIQKIINTTINLLCDAYTKGFFPRIFDRKFEINLKKEKIQKFKTNVEDYEIVSFDIFDTLLKRSCGDPESLFELIELKYNAKGFAIERKKAEIRARNLKAGHEITYENIYEQILPKYRKYKDIEQYEERQCLFVNDELRGFLKTCKESGKRVIGISDMYFSEIFISGILHNNHVILDALYVSSEVDKTKARGDLFAFVKKQEGNIKKIIHIGDNYKSDVLVAKKYNFDAICYRGSDPGVDFKPYKNKLAIQLHLDIVRKISEFSNSFEKIGFVLAGPIALSYTNFICDEAIKNEINSILFVARDGWILKKLFELKEKGKKIKSSYVYLNRYVGIVSTLAWQNNPKYLKMLLRYYSQFLPEISISDDYKKNIKTFEQNKIIIKKRAAINYAELNEHLLKSIHQSENVALVDVTTSSFSSYIFAKQILADKLVNAFYLLSYIDNTSLLRYQIFNPKPIEIGSKNIVELLEVLLSSPEPPIVGISNGVPVYAKIKDKDQRKMIYNSIERGVIRYAESFTKSYGWTKALMLSFDDWNNFVKDYLKQIDVEDLEQLRNIGFSSEPDGNSQMHSVV